MYLYLLSREPGSREVLHSIGEAGRWNREQVPCKYLVDSPAMCIAESQLFDPVQGVTPDTYIQVIDVPEGSILHFREEQLPRRWWESPYNPATQELGSLHLRMCDKLLLAFPSAKYLKEWNYVLNVSHPLQSKVKIVSHYLAMRREFYELSSAMQRSISRI